MKNKTIFCLLVLTMISSSLSAKEAEINKDELKRAIKGSLVTIINMQIQDREGKNSPLYDACNEGDGCRNAVALRDVKNRVWLPSGPPLPKITNRAGEWISTIHFFGDSLGNKNRELFFSVPDSNMFVTASALYSLSFFDLEASQILKNLTTKAASTIDNYKRNSAYSFWEKKDSYNKQHRIIGPRNLPGWSFELFGFRFWNKFPRDSSIPEGRREHWVDYLVDKEINPIGAEAMYNIPSDADDTALAMITKRLYAPDTSLNEISELAAEISSHRDMDRTWEDPRDTWKGSGSGAFLTWLKEENLDPIASLNPVTGSIPFGVNNVDCVVNANVLFALAVSNNLMIAGADEALDTMSKAIEQKSWPECGLYYPQKMMFPYAITRAYRDGGVRTDRFEAAMGLLLRDLLAEQRNYSSAYKKKKGAFPGGFDTTDDLSTGLGLVSILNIGEAKAKEIGLLEEYRKSVKSAVSYLLKSSVRSKPRVAKALLKSQSKIDENFLWRAGIFFSASKWSTAQWRSQPYTVAIILEALTKYQLDWHKFDNTILEDDSKLRVEL